MQGHGLGLGAGSRTEVFAGLDNYRAALSPTPSSGRRRRGCCGYGLIARARRCSAWPCCSRCCWTRAGPGSAGFSRIAIFLPYAVPGVIASLLWGFLYLPGRQPVLLHPRAARLPTTSTCSARQRSYFAVANIALWGGIGFNMIVIYTALRADPARAVRGGPHRRRSELQIALRIKIPMVTPALVHDHGLLDHRHAAGVQRADDAAAADQHDLQSTWTPLMKVYRDAFVRDDIYSAAATSVVIAVATLVAVLRLPARWSQPRAFGQENR